MYLLMNINCFCKYQSRFENLRRRIKVQNSSFNTVAKQNYSYSNIYDIVFVDECSTISNGDMLKLLSRIQCKLLVLVGDVYQIEAVKFGNWFSLAKSFIPQKATHELQVPRRTEDADLLELWSKVRCVDPHISEFMVKKGYSSKLNDSIFDMGCRRSDYPSALIMTDYTE